jgi:hypothetical protein
MEIHIQEDPDGTPSFEAKIVNLNSQFSILSLT